MSVVGKQVQDATLDAYADGKISRVSLGQHLKGCTVFLFYPLDFTFVCPTEILGFSALREDFAKEGATLLLVSCDSAHSHKGWAEQREGGVFGNTIPMLSDKSGRLAKSFGVYVEEEGRSRRASFIVQDGVVVYEVVHADPIGRSSCELMRVVRALNRHRDSGEICPFNWSADK